VGIGGGIPSDEREDNIQLGDVVVSKPTSTFGRVVQYDMGKVKDGALFQLMGLLVKPPASAQRLQALQARIGSQIPGFLLGVLQKYPKMTDYYVYQDSDKDQLFMVAYCHQGGSTCKNCGPKEAVERMDRPNTNPRIHYGTVGSGNVVIKDVVTREQLREELGVLCVEMEPAGLKELLAFIPMQEVVPMSRALMYSCNDENVR
jgi:nucleoside phosphorylase